MEQRTDANSEADEVAEETRSKLARIVEGN